MAFVARKPFLFAGTHYRPGDVIPDFQEKAFRPEGFIRTGMVYETTPPVEVKPAAAKPAAKKTAVKKTTAKAQSESAEV